MTLRAFFCFPLREITVLFWNVDARFFRIGQYYVAVTGQDMVERHLQTPAQIAWEKALGGDHCGEPMPPALRFIEE